MTDSEDVYSANTRTRSRSVRSLDARSLAPLITDPEESVTNRPSLGASDYSYEYVIVALRRWGAPVAVVGVPLLLMASAALSIPSAPDGIQRRSSSSSDEPREYFSNPPGSNPMAPSNDEPIDSTLERRVTSRSARSEAVEHPSVRRGFSPVRERPDPPPGAIIPSPEVLGVNAIPVGMTASAINVATPIEEQNPMREVSAPPAEQVAPPVESNGEPLREQAEAPVSDSETTSRDAVEPSPPADSQNDDPSVEPTPR
jgi:hypothetical protein